MISLVIFFFGIIIVLLFGMIWILFLYYVIFGCGFSVIIILSLYRSKKRIVKDI